MVALKFGGVVHSLKEVYPELFAIAVDKALSGIFWKQKIPSRVAFFV